MANNRRWDEIGVVEMDAEVVVDTTNTYDVWKKRAQDNVMMTCVTTSTRSAGNGLLEIKMASTTTDLPIGPLRSVGPGPKAGRLAVTIAIAALDGNILGIATDAALASDGSDVGKQTQCAADGRSTIQTTNAGGARVIGGTKGFLRGAWDFRDNLR